MANTLNLGNGQWATKEGSLLAYNSENNNYKPLPFNFERDSIATRVNKEGLIEVVGRDIPRIDYTDSTEGSLLLEPQSTNLLTYSEDFSQSIWVKNSTGTGTNPTLDFGYTSPDGSLNATKIIFNVGAGSSAADLSLFKTTISAINGVATIYLKGDTGGEDISFLAGNTRENIILTNSWKRYTLSNTSLSQLVLRLRGDQNTNNSCTIYVWGAQLEVGSFPTSYIKSNSGSAVTRLADVCNNGGNDQVINSTEGVLYAEMKNDIVQQQTISLTKGSSDSVQLGLINGNIRLAIVSNGNAVLSTLSPAFIYKNNLYNKYAIVWNNTNAKIFINGDLKSTITTPSPLGLDKLNFNNPVSSENMSGNVKDVRVYNTALSDSELQALTQV